MLGKAGFWSWSKGLFASGDAEENISYFQASRTRPNLPGADRLSCPQERPPMHGTEKAKMKKRICMLVDTPESSERRAN